MKCRTAGATPGYAVATAGNLGIQRRRPTCVGGDGHANFVSVRARSGPHRQRMAGVPGQPAGRARP